MTDLAFACRCGTVAGSLHGATPEAGTRVVCYCADCRAFARHLGDAAVLDAAGGSDIYQTSMGRLVLDAGRDAVGCLRMTSRGPLRWYATCCDSALSNSAPTGAVPFGSLFVARLAGDHDALGPVRARVFVKSALPVPEGRPPRGHGVGLVMTRFVRTALAARLAGDHRRHAFFPDGRPLAKPRRLTDDERRRAYA